MPASERPRVLHVLGSLNRGGVETWLLHVLRHTPREWWEPHFLLHRSAAGAYAAEMRALGARLHHCGGTRQPISYARALRSVLREQGPFDVVHSHVHLYSGFVLRIAQQEGIPVRIAHSHTTQNDRGLGRRLYARVMQRWIRRYATVGLAVSADAASALFGANWRDVPHIELYNLGRDYAEFARLPARAAVKREFGWPPERVVIGHVGRFAAVKNHRFLLDVFEAVLRSGLDAQLLLVGGGPLELELRGEARRRGIQGRCCFAGEHDDVARFYGAMDVLVLPSLHEGFPLVALEAQAAGLPLLASAAVPARASVIPGLLQRMALSEGADAWARAVQQLVVHQPERDRAESARAMMNSSFGIAAAAATLARLYGVRVPTAVAQVAT